jgi:hypothetical protein
VLLLAPLLVGAFAGRSWSAGTLYLSVAALAGFLLRQPLTLLVKVRSGRRGRDILPAVGFWTGVWGAFGLVGVGGLILQGHADLLWLAVPAGPILGWHLWLVARRAERRQWLVEVLASGALALAAPATFWIGVGGHDPRGWWLWALMWAQSATSIDYAFLRLRQRPLTSTPPPGERVRMALSPLLLASVGILGAAALGFTGTLSRWLFVPHAVQGAEVIYGTLRPAVGYKPKAIGFRQLTVSTLFTLLFILLWGQ